MGTGSLRHLVSWYRAWLILSQKLASGFFLLCIIHVPVGVAFPWRRCGFSSAADMLKCMSDTCRFEYSPKDSEYRLYGIGTREMFMPSWVVEAQSKHFGLGEFR